MNDNGGPKLRFGKGYRFAAFMLFLETYPSLEPLRGDPRYAALVAKVRAETRSES